MKLTKQTLPKNVVELTIEVATDELKPFLETAAKEISQNKPIEGFRPGKASYEMIKQRFGEMTILQQATNALIAEFYYQAIDQEGLQTVDQPEIEIVKMAPENPFIFKAKVALLPSIELCDYQNIKLKAVTPAKVTDDEVKKVIDDIRKMRATDKKVERAAKMGDKIEVNFETFVDGVAIAGGKADKYQMVLGDKQMIPGFEEAIVGLTAGEKKEFELSFPKDYHNTNIAGKKAKFKIEVLTISEIQLPELNEEFVKSLGAPSKEELEKQIKHNLEHEKLHKDMDAKDLELLNALIDKTKFGDIPDVLLNSETHKMMEELKDNVARQGLEFTEYLNHLKKKESDLLLDFTPDALKRVKTSLIIRAVAEKENITTNEKEIDFERQRTLQSYQYNPAMAEQLKQIEANIKSEAAERYFSNVIVNRKTIEFLRQTMIEGYAKHEHDHDHEHEEETEEHNHDHQNTPEEKE